MLDSPRYVCCKKYSVSWLFKLAITAPSVPFGGVVCCWKKLGFLERNQCFGLIIILLGLKGLHKLRITLFSTKFTILRALVAAFCLCLGSGVAGFLLELQRCPFLRHKRPLTQDFLLFFMYSKGWLSFKSVKVQLLPGYAVLRKHYSQKTIYMEYIRLKLGGFHV